MTSGKVFLLPSGKRLLRRGGKVHLSGTEVPCCCGQCSLYPTDCPYTNCTSEAFTVCCWKCGDTASVTFGGITAGTATEPWVGTAVAAMIPAVENQTITATLIEVDQEPAPGGGSVFEWYSGELDRDLTHVYGAMVQLSPTQSGVVDVVRWIVQVFVWRVALSDWIKAGPCQNVEREVVISQPTDWDGTCCGQDYAEPIPVNPAVSAVDPVTDFVSTSSCDQICDCDDFPSSLLVEADCITTTVTSSDPCVWGAFVSTGAEPDPCDLVETTVNLRHTNGALIDESDCGWVITIDQLIYGLVGENCEVVGNVSVTAQKIGGGPIGTYTIISGTGCGTTIEVS